MVAKAADWSALDDLLLVEIGHWIVLYTDFAAFRRVCTSWRSAVPEQNFKLRMPWLLLPPKICSDLRNFVIPPQGVTRRTLLPEANGKMYFSSKGWLITIAQDLSINLLHPFSRYQIKLPHIKSFDNWRSLDMSAKTYVFFIQKVVLSSDPLLTSNSIVMVIHGDRGVLAYSKPGDKTWTTINTWRGKYFDITYYEERFYAINSHGKIMVCDVRGNNPTIAQEVANMPYNIPRWEKAYIVESSGRLLVVTRDGVALRPIKKWSSQTTYGNYGFKVYEVDLSTNNWTRIKDLGNTTLFLGHNSSMSIESDGVYAKPNKIYFTDDCVEAYWFKKKGGGKDMGIYNIEDGSIEPYLLEDSRNRLTPPMWVEQS
ncbi:hypothetical protein Dsin_007347 [Dipteronia sinensis]|uniref:KIB1-4 beta-propeller domain-containing protein n=1 Tax=Dipteronia sinensis TaxID=43782 RepID=A0AAE0EIC0_9ROSI|nr:hypothetical protein Dsin_007347 [Dipteronia sinensis]